MATATPDTAPLLQVRDLQVEFVGRNRVVRAVRGLNYELRAGETLAIVGESGSGKSVSAMTLLGLLPKRTSRITSGTALFEGRDLLTLPSKELEQVRGARIAMIFQDPLSSLNPVLTIERQITEALERHTKLTGPQQRARAIELLKLVGIPDAERRLKDYPHQYSGGMRQRAMIAIALSCEPSLLIADEPTTALDVTIQAQILALIARLRSELGMAVLLITHDLGIVAGLADRIAVMYAGRVIETGPTEQVLVDPAQPYTAGLLRSLPRLDVVRTGPLTPIEGTPPDLASSLPGCPFAPRCAWRIPDCWTVDPALAPTREPELDRAIACHNPPTPDEAAAGRPDRPGFTPALPPEDITEEVVVVTGSAA
ncbi:MAG: ABC transporter ATP-binding protein [Chloroflexota bacterium]